MLAALWEFLGAAAGSLVKMLFGRWLSDDPERDALRAKKLEAKNLAKPVRDWRDTVDDL